jgi:hypothetical protein
VAVDERAINRSFAAVFNARPHLFNFTSVRTGTGTSGTVTIVDPIKIPLSPVVLDWSLGIALPQLDLYPQNSAPQQPLTLEQRLLSTAFAIEIFDPGSTTTGSSGALPVRCSRCARCRLRWRDQRRDLRHSSQCNHSRQSVLQGGSADALNLHAKG